MIHRIYSSLPSFKSLEFHSGLNVLIAQKEKGASDKQTRNRAGKTSLVEIVHFLTGADVERDSPFRSEALTDSMFGMDFDIDASRVSVERREKERAKIHIAGEKLVAGRTTLSNTKWVELLGEHMFALGELSEYPSRKPTFRSLFSYFVRRQSSRAFSTPEKQSEKQQIVDCQIALLYLLGLDWEIASAWQRVRDREKSLQELKKATEDQTLGGIIGKVADLRTQFTVAKDKLKDLKAQINSFRVLPQYHEMENEMNNLTLELNDLANRNTIDRAAIQDLEKSLDSETAPSLDNLKEIYEEAGVVLPNIVTKRYEEVRNFHKSVIRNRRDYLSDELSAAKERIRLRDQVMERRDQRRSEIMDILQSHGALEQFAKLQGEAGRLESEVEALRKRFEAAELLEGTKTELKIERNHLELRLQRDFAEQKQRLDEAILAFEEISNKLYESAGSMTLDVTQNGPVFRFPMQGSRSKGIQNMQIFCFDLMLMLLCSKRGIGPSFLIHDSHLFDGVDGRQVISALKVGAETARTIGFQYIVTMNEDDAFKEKTDGFDLHDFILPVVLTDATEDGGLFGFRF